MSKMFYIRFAEERYFVYEVPEELRNLPLWLLFEKLQERIHELDCIEEKQYPVPPFHDVDPKTFNTSLERKLRKYGRKVYDGDSEGWNDEIRVRECTT
jgi:hypothetical protein